MAGIKIEVSKIVDKKPERINRSAFLYMDPKEPKDRFAQCGACMMWTGKKAKTCTIHGPKVEILEGDSCALYVHGKPMPGEAGHEMESVTPKESGLYHGEVRCENCRYYYHRMCELFESLNNSMGDFNLDSNVHPKGCCNAFMPK